MTTILVNPIGMTDEDLADHVATLATVFGCDPGAINTGRADYLKWIPYERSWEAWAARAPTRYDQIVIFGTIHGMAKGANAVANAAIKLGKPLCWWDGALFYTLPPTATDRSNP